MRSRFYYKILRNEVEEVPQLPFKKDFYKNEIRVYNDKLKDIEVDKYYMDIHTLKVYKLNKNIPIIK